MRVGIPQSDSWGLAETFQDRRYENLDLSKWMGGVYTFTLYERCWYFKYCCQNPELGAAYAEIAICMDIGFGETIGSGMESTVEGINPRSWRQFYTGVIRTVTLWEAELQCRLGQRDFETELGRLQYQAL